MGLAGLQASQMHNQGDQSVNVSLITTPTPLYSIKPNYTPHACPHPRPFINIVSEDNSAVAAEELLAAFLSHHRPFPTRPARTRPVFLGLSQSLSLSVSHSGRMQLSSYCSDKRRERHYLLSVDMTVVWTQRVCRWVCVKCREEQQDSIPYDVIIKTTALPL